MFYEEPYIVSIKGFTYTPIFATNIGYGCQ